MSQHNLRFFNPDAPIEKSGGSLPHWEQDDSTYFLTFRVADSVPSGMRKGWEEEKKSWLANHPEPWIPEVELEFHRRFSQRMERWLDQGHGACPFREARLRAILVDTLHRLDGVHYTLCSYVIMPNHVHLLASLFHGTRLPRTMQGWKGIVSHEVRKQGLWKGGFWQAGYFDRMIRDESHFTNCARYIRRNPSKAGLKQGEFDLHECDWVKSL